MSKKPAPDAWQPFAEGRDTDGHRHAISPDGTIRISFEATEVRNNEWFESPTVTEVTSGRTLLHLLHPWNAYEEWTGPPNFAMHVGKGPGRPSIRVEVDVDARTITIIRTGKTYPLARAERVTFPTPDRLELLAGYRPARQGMPTLLFFHGNGASWQSSAQVTDQLVAQGFGLLAAEYRGYGGNPGTPSEGGLYQDARGAWNFLRGQGVDDEDVVLGGNSLGAAVALNLATEVTAWALVLVSPFNNLVDTAARRMSWLPLRLLLNDRYANDEKIVQIGEPILILHGEDDSLIALEQAQALAFVRDDTVIETFPGWGHDLIAHNAVQDRIVAFVGVSNQP